MQAMIPYDIIQSKQYTVCPQAVQLWSDRKTCHTGVEMLFAVYVVFSARLVSLTFFVIRANERKEPLFRRFRHIAFLARHCIH